MNYGKIKIYHKKFLVIKFLFLINSINLVEFYFTSVIFNTVNIANYFEIQITTAIIFIPRLLTVDRGGISNKSVGMTHF